MKMMPSYSVYFAYFMIDIKKSSKKMIAYFKAPIITSKTAKPTHSQTPIEHSIKMKNANRLNY